MANMKKCKMCGEEIAENAKICPKCGANNMKPFYKKWWIWVMAVCVVIIIAAASGNNGDTENSIQNTESNVENVENNAENNNNPPVQQDKKEKYEVVGDAVLETDSFGFVHIKGTVKNNSGKDRSYLSITYNLYDAEGNQIGTAMDNINNLEKDGTWKFDATGIDIEETVDSFKLVEISGF